MPSVVCPSCNSSTDVQLPDGACLAFYRCGGCKKIIKAKSCCVVCDYSSSRCSVSTKR